MEDCYVVDLIKKESINVLMVDTNMMTNPANIGML